MGVTVYKDTKVKMRKDPGLRGGVRFSIAALLLLAVVEVVAVFLYF